MRPASTLTRPAGSETAARARDVGEPAPGVRDILAETIRTTAELTGEPTPILIWVWYRDLSAVVRAHRRSEVPK